MSVKIVFNGTEYDGVEAMPPDVRRAYEAALESLGKAGGETLASLLKDGSGGGAGGAGGASIKATFREIVVNGKKYGSPDEMPPDIRRSYEEAMASLAPDEGAAPPSRGTPPPLLEEVTGRRGKLWRTALWIAIVAFGVVWVLRHR